MGTRLEGKIAIVTGAGSGMGHAISRAFANEGASVLCADISGKQEDTAAAIGASAIPVRVDVSDSDDIQRMIAVATERWGRFDILVNNAGLHEGAALFHEQADDSFDRIVAVNLRGVFLGMKYGIISMLKSGGGSIINMASIGGLVGAPNLSSYAATKGGVVQLTKTAALEYARQDIRANAICPGLIWTPMVHSSIETRVPGPDVPPPAWVPVGRWGLDTEIAATAVFLASDEAKYLTGAAIPVDGGATAG